MPSRREVHLRLAEGVYQAIRGRAAPLGLSVPRMAEHLVVVALGMSGGTLTDAEVGGRQEPGPEMLWNRSEVGVIHADDLRPTMLPAARPLTRQQRRALDRQQAKRHPPDPRLR